MKTKFFTWATVARIYNAMPLGVCECKTIKDAKGYTKVLVLIVIAFLLAGMYDAFSYRKEVRYDCFYTTSANNQD